MNHDLPLQILERILLKLSVKTLVLCTSVCKEWKSLITDPSFISDHLNHTVKANKGSQNLLFRRWGLTVGLKESFSLHVDNDQLDLLLKVEYPLNDYCHDSCRPTHSQLVGTCNGLVCLYNFCMGFIIWNPSIRRYIVLPKHILDIQDGEFVKNFGFGFDFKSKDFKVIRLVSQQPSSPEVEVYSLTTRSWKTLTGNKVPSFTLERLFFARSNHMFKDGVLHWAAIRNQAHENFILTFDLVEETFGEIMLPESLREKDNMIYVLGGGDFLTVIHSFSQPSLPSFGVEEYFNVWVMKEYGNVESWTKVYTGIAKSRSRPIWYRKNGDVLLHCNSGKIFAINEEIIRSDREKIRIKGHGQASLSYYVESLFLLDQSTDDVMSY